MSDSERVRTVLDQAGMVWTDNEEEANIIGILACSVRQKAIDKIYNKIAIWNKKKSSRNLITFISGCILPDDHRQFLKLFDLVFKMKDLPQLPEMISQYGVSSPVMQQIASLKGLTKTMDEFWDVKPSYQSSFEGFIPIQNGCDKFCTFCAVPYTRGREVSRPASEILDEFKDQVDRGFKSITLLGQNVNSYGLDRRGKEVGFATLLEQIGAYGDQSGKNPWVYFTSPHPRDMKRDVLEVIAKYKCLANQIHIPLQSGDDEVLKKMNRQHTLDTYRKIIHNIRELLPEATIFTDIIVGFTGETDEQLEQTRKAIAEFQYNMIYLAKYSPRPGAASYRWQDDVSNEVKSARHAILTEELRKHSSAYNHSLVGKTIQVLVTRRDQRHPEYLAGYNEGKINIRFRSEKDALVGQFVNVKVTAAADFSIEGELVKELAV